MPDLASPRVFALPCGVDYPAALIAGLAERLPVDDPTAWARATIYVSSGRMLRRIREVFDHGPPRLLPRLRLVSDLADVAGSPDIPRAMPPLHLKLDLAQLILSLIESQPDLAPRSAAFDLAESLAALIDEMHGEGVGPDALAALDVGAFADHWKRGRAIVEAAFTHFGETDDRLAGAEARRRLIVATLATRWQDDPPKDPIIIAGSTGSRGATRLLMEAVARLPQGYVVLPGFDFDQPYPVWTALDRELAGEDHPQFRFRKLMTELEMSPEDVHPWSDARPSTAARNRVISLALRPAPVTDQWRIEGRKLTHLAEATARMTLVEAPSQRAEAVAIALRLRQAIEDGQSAALISPDRMLTRRVTAALQRWNIEPDDSAGEPLHQAAPGRFLRHVAGLMETVPDLPALLILLKHPLTASTDGLRGPHLRWTRELELYLRKHAVQRPAETDLLAWVDTARVKDGRADWAAWLSGILGSVSRGAEAGLGMHVAHHLALAERLASGPDSTGGGTLWQGRSGEQARLAMTDLQEAGGRGGALTARDYSNLLRSHLSGFNVLDPNRPHPGVMIWGTLEARVGGADLTILGGLNDGTWPDLPAPDTWLNRQMRHDVGLLLPDRRIGLAAHDFQQAVAASEVMLTRPVRDEDAETVPSRWVNRLTNLLSGLGEDGTVALSAMRDRGQGWLRMAAVLDQPETTVPLSRRPAPCPPLVARPRQLSVTRITQLIRDPYAIYARHVLRLKRLDPLVPAPDARLRGLALHDIMEGFLDARAVWRGDRKAARACLSEVAWRVLSGATPQPSMQMLWHARLMGVADRLIDGEFDRLAAGEPVLTEDWGRLGLSELDFTLIARPDRIDRLHAGGYAIYDYKSGQPPTGEMVKHFDKQLPLEAAMLERGGFGGLEPGPITALGYIALGASGKDRMLKLDDADDGPLIDVTWDRLHDLIRRYGQRTQGYTAIRAAQLTTYAGDYDHLSRFGEWDLTDPADPVLVGNAEEET